MLGISEAHVGQLAGLTTSVLWTGTSLLFTAAGRRIGPTLTNSLRIGLAVVLLGVTHRLLSGTWVPATHPRQVLLLAWSGLIGLSIGDQALFTAFVSIGPRLSMLIMTTAPLLAALLGWLVLDERLHATAWLGIAFTVAGVSWVVLERPRAAADTGSRHRLRGILLAFVASACQGIGVLLSKQGIGHGWLPEREHLTPQAATFLRMFFAALGLIPLVYAYWRRERRLRSAGLLPAHVGSPRAGLLMAVGGALVGPYLGVWMSLEAIHRAPLGIGQTLCSLPPLFVLPFARLVYREPISYRAIAGAFVAVGGVALLFVSPG